MNHCRWHLLPPAPVQLVAGMTGLPPLVVQLLYNRGLTEPTRIEAFLMGDARLSGDPFLLPDIRQAVARIYQALLSGETIAVYGDFDVDGITGTALLTEGLTRLGGKVIPYIPHRLTEGYGLKAAALESLYQQGVGLVVTVDCGITALNQVKKANRLGLDVIITDHHTPLEEVPPALAVIDPKREARYPFPDLAGVGVAYKLLQALFRGVGREAQLEGLLDLVALGTVADMVSVLGENRLFVRQGLAVLNAAPRLGIRELMTQAGLNNGTIDPGRISWVIAPRLNTAGRLEHAMTSYRLLTTDSPEEAHELGLWLEQKNTERQNLTARFVDRAREQVMARGLTPLLVASDEEYPSGIAGLVANRLSEEFYRPAVVVKVGETMSGGSCRSIPEFNMIAALNQCRHLFAQYGGHAQAAGFTMPTRHLPQLAESLLELATTQLAGVDLRPRLDIDVVVSLRDLVGDTFQVMQQLSPFGEGNPLPTFLSRGVEVVDCRAMGDNSEHLRLKLKQNGAVWSAVGFGLGHYLAEMTPRLDIVFNLEIDAWGGRETLRLNLLDFAKG
ncbi:MAG: single-stranded-DNA-specific exonuclease RecJ [Chloroflexi bacterium]|nr:single-stranded-DNA-specific exonuclease RecJ [Chloroflexota bacterium]